MSDHISVCICTYRRNRMLTRLLRNLALQETRDQFTFSVVVVDNDHAGSARADVTRLGSELGLDIIYGIEPERTIPAARNHALRLAKGSYIGIIDDDEFPPPHWLVTLFEAVQRFDVDGALGPVYPFFEQPPPAWIVKSRLLDRRSGRPDHCCNGNRPEREMSCSRRTYLTGMEFILTSPLEPVGQIRLSSERRWV